ncbi:hypothetical protein Pyrfu_1755 [Pyrolobus fumarii 1A]|uniref:Uncharacterized protein n=1 Tax=Pyrolobus fumarii (strain DSM 11204 / 1A) TaxID=694429 RepID=G0ECN9_PYRF1|nr:hypothetical protein [Pyrolobus fumarii]AEM39609.1 hypothetical protein Pyrfu_1755 [Pyrolobus fumarii 1A]
MDVSGREIAEYLRELMREFRRNPLINASNVFYAGMVIAVLGMIKDSPYLKIIGDILSDSTDKIRNLIVAKYSVLGTLGEFQAAYTKLAEATVEEIYRLVNVVADIIEEGDARDARLADVLNKLYDLLVVKLPVMGVSVTIEAPEE